eukprot:SAG22_NODE_11729_length_471_cov_2.190860_1_plen_129_part_10
MGSAAAGGARLLRSASRGCGTPTIASASLPSMRSELWRRAAQCSAHPSHLQRTFFKMRHALALRPRESISYAIFPSWHPTSCTLVSVNCRASLSQLGLAPGRLPAAATVMAAAAEMAVPVKQVRWVKHN